LLRLSANHEVHREPNKLGLRAPPTFSAWRAVCTRPGNVFTAPWWCAITSDSSFMQANFSLQSELSLFFRDLLHLAIWLPVVTGIVTRV